MDYDQHEHLYGQNDYDYNYTDTGDGYGTNRPAATKNKKPLFCKRCGYRDVKWKQVEGNWRLYNKNTDTLHVCEVDMKSKAKPLTYSEKLQREIDTYPSYDDYLDAKAEQREREELLEEERQIIQIATSGYSYSSTCTLAGHASSLVALCNDGTIWSIRDLGRDGEWNKLPPIPQDEDK